MSDDERLAPLKALLEAREIARDLIEIRVTAGSAGTEFVTAVAPSERPGVGLVTAVRAGGKLFSAALGRGFGALAAQCGWHYNPPSATEVLAALAHTDFDGQLSADGPEALSLSTGHGLRLTGTVRGTFDSAPRRLTLSVAPGGVATVSLTPLAPEIAAPRAIDAVTEAVRALDGGGVAAIGAMRQLAGNPDSRAIAALIRATTRWEEAIWVEALGALPADVATIAPALADAWHSLDSGAVTERLDVADALRGSSFSGALRRALAERAST